jgi:hypothetical protein
MPGMTTLVHMSVATPRLAVLECLGIAVGRVLENEYSIIGRVVVKWKS